MNKNGFTILELLVSIIILSIVLTFAMNLFLKVRSAYSNEKTNIELEVTKSIIIDAVMSDIDEYGVSVLSCSQNKVSIRLGNSAIIDKTLEFNTSNSDYDLIKYSELSNPKKLVRKLPKGSLKGNLNCTSKLNSEVGAINHINYKIEDENGNDYSIDMFIVE